MLIIKNKIFKIQIKWYLFNIFPTIAHLFIGPVNNPIVAPAVEHLPQVALHGLGVWLIATHVVLDQPDTGALWRLAVNACVLATPDEVAVGVLAGEVD